MTAPAPDAADGLTEDDDGTEDDELPAEDDPWWAEHTRNTLRHLRVARARHRAEKLRENAYRGYVAALVVLIYVVPPVLSAVRAPATGAHPAAPGVPLGAVAVALLVLVALVRDGLWRGPVLLDPASAAWLLPLPLHRAALLRPRLHRALLAAGLLGAAVGATAGALLRLVTRGSAVLLALSGGAAGALVLVLGVALGALVSAADGRARGAVLRAGTALWLLPVLPAAFVAVRLAGLAGARGDGGPDRIAASVALWSGPWGWALQPLAAALSDGTDAPPGTSWPVAAVAALAAVTVAVVAAHRGVTGLTNRALRARAATVSAVTQSLGTLQPRRARLLVEAAQGRSPNTRWRLPPPHTRLLLVPWRDATALLRYPSRLVWSALWTATAVPLVAAGTGTSGLARFALVVVGLLAQYLGAAQLVEAARLDADDPRTVRSLPLATTRVALAHLVTPLAVLAAGVGTALGVVALTAPPSWAPSVAAVLLPAALPALTGAALVSAFRGDVPLGLLSTGAGSPTGDPGPVLLVLWWLRGPLAAIALLVPTALGGPVPLGTTVAGAVMISWSTRRAAAVLGP